MTEAEWAEAHALNMRTSEPMADTPFWKWLDEQEDPPTRAIDALRRYTGGLELKGRFKVGPDDDMPEWTAYRHMLSHWWWKKLNKEKNEAEA